MKGRDLFAQLFIYKYSLAKHNEAATSSDSLIKLCKGST
jgi:hypothetical protein